MRWTLYDKVKTVRFGFDSTIHSYDVSPRGLVHKYVLIVAVRVRHPDFFVVLTISSTVC